MSYDVLFMTQHFILYSKPSLQHRKRRVTDDFDKRLEDFKESFSPLKNTGTVVKKTPRVYDI